MTRKRRTYEKKFNERAVKLYVNGDKSQREISEDLGIDRSLLSQWCREYGKENAFPGQGNPRDEEMYNLRRELKDVKEERDISCPRRYAAGG